MSAITGGNVKISQLTGLDTISNGAKLRIPVSIDNSATSTPNWVSYSVDGEVLSYFIKNNIGINNLESELERQNVQISDLRHDVSSNYTQITNLGSDLNTLQHNVDGNSGKISTLENGFNTQNGQITTLKTYVGDQNIQISALEGNLSTLQSDVAENSRRITSLEQAQGGGSGGSGDFATYTQLTDVDTRLTGEINSVKGDLQSYIQTYSGKISTLKSYIDAHSGYLSSYSVRITYLETDKIPTLEGNLSTLQSDVNRNSERITSLEQAQGGGSGGSDVTTEQLNELKTEINSVNSNLTGEINSVKNDLQTYSGKISTLEGNLKTYSDKIKENSDGITNLGNDLSTLRSYVDAHSGYLLSYSEQIQNNSYDITNLKANVDNNSESITNFGNSLSTLQSDVAAHSTKIANLEQAQSGNNNALLRYEVGYFSGVEIIVDSTIIEPKAETPASNSGKVVFCNRLYNSIEGIYAGFVYKLGEDYYLTVPDNFPYAMPSRNGIAIKIRDYSGVYYDGIDDDCAYVINGKELKKFIPKATDSSAGLLSVEDKNKLDACVTTEATTSAAGLMSVEDKNKLDACVTTEATTSADGLMSSAHVITLNNTLSRMEVGYFSDTVILPENERISPSIMMPSSIFGEIVFCNRIFSSGSLYAGFVYRLGNNYYKTVPNGFRYRMPSRTGIAIYLNDGCAYVINGNELKKFIPVGTAGVSGLMPPSVLTRLDDIETRLAKLEGSPTLTSESEVEA